MILASPFSRQHRSHQTWHGGHQSQTPASQAHHQPAWLQRHQSGASTLNHNRQQQPQNVHPAYSSASLRRPAPQQPAPQRPRTSGQQPGGNGAPQIMLEGPGRPQQQHGFRSSTLNRLDALRARQQHQHQNGASPRRNLSSLGHYPTLPGSQTAATRAAVNPPPVSIPNGHARLITATRDTPIYAPASIASPRELANYGRDSRHHPQQQQQQQQHYASTSVRGFELDGPRTASAQPARSGRESALSGLFERFGTLRRKARRHWPPFGASSSRSSSRLGGGGGRKSAAAEEQDSNRPLEAGQIYAEGQRAIDGNGQRRLLEHELQPALMREGETRTLIEEDSMRQPDYLELVGLLAGWINDELAEQRIIVRDLQDDLNDGQVLCKLLERLQCVKLDIIEVTQNELAQKFKLKTFLDSVNRTLALQARWARIRWTMEGIHGKNLVEIIHLLVTLALYYQAPIRMPANVQVGVLVFQKHQGQLIKRSHRAQLTDELVATLDLRDPGRFQRQRGVFDLLVECAPEKLATVKQSLVRFCDRHLNKINMSCCSSSTSNDLEPDQFSDGLLLVLLISSLEDFFVPLGNLFTTIRQESLTARHHHLKRPASLSPLPFVDANNNNNNNNSDRVADEASAHLYASSRHRNKTPAAFVQTDLDAQSLEQFVADRPTALEPASYVNTQPIEKLHNVNVALQLIEEAGVSVRQRVRAEDVVNGDLKAVLCVLYALFSRYKHL